MQMKSWSHFCFLVLAVSSVSRGQSVALPTAGVHVGYTSPPPGEATNQTADRPHLHQNHTGHTENGTSTVATTEDDKDSVTAEKTERGNGTEAPVLVPGISKEDDKANETTTVYMPKASTSPNPENTDASTHPSSWGYVILVLIILVIIILCVILYLLRRVSRTYSFDLQRPSPSNHLNEPTGTFEPVYLDDLDRPAIKDQVATDDLSPPPAANGTTLQSEEKGSNGESAAAAHEQPDANGVETSHTSNTSPSLSDEQAEKPSGPLNCADVFFDAVEEEQKNENNNNPSVCSSDPFVEINLDDPAWCNQLLAAPEAPSSVLPFSPFSFSSSSSSSS